MLVVDQELDVAQTCKLTSDEALSMLQPLHAMIDEEIQKRAASFSFEFKKSCEDDCHCGVYSDLALDSKLKDELYKKAQNMDKKQLKKCATETSVWFCQSPLFDAIKSQIETATPSGL